MARSVKEELGQIVIRPAPGMREKIKELANSRGRSMNAEIVEAITDHIQRAELEAAGWAWVPPHHRIEPDLLRRIEEMASGSNGNVRYQISRAIMDYIHREESTDEEIEKELKVLVTEIVDLVRYQVRREAEQEEDDRDAEPA